MKAPQAAVASADGPRGDPPDVDDNNALPDPARTVTLDGTTSCKTVAENTPNALRNTRSSRYGRNAEPKIRQELSLGAGPRTQPRQRIRSQPTLSPYPPPRRPTPPMPILARAQRPRPTVSAADNAGFVPGDIPSRAHLHATSDSTADAATFVLAAGTPHCNTDSVDGMDNRAARTLSASNAGRESAREMPRPLVPVHGVRNTYNGPRELTLPKVTSRRRVVAPLRDTFKSMHNQQITEL
jgi:hypothetical protein